MDLDLAERLLERWFLKSNEDGSENRFAFPRRFSPSVALALVELSKHRGEMGLNAQQFDQRKATCTSKEIVHHASMFLCKYLIETLVSLVMFSD